MTKTKPKSTATFDRYNRSTNQACVAFHFPEAPELSRNLRRWYHYGELVAAAREHEWMAPVLDAAKAAGLH